MSVDDAIKSLIEKNKDYLPLLRTIAQVDMSFENGSFGWQFKDVSGLQGAHVNVLLQNNIIVYGYKSNSATHFRLNVAAEQLNDILDGIELSMLQAEKQKLTSQGGDEVDLDPALVNEFEHLIGQIPDMLTYWALRLNPRIIGMERERKACLISMASPPDKNGIMRRCHTLIHGPPGTAKSLIINYIKHYFCAVGISPKTTSEVGMTVNAQSGTDGALVMAHGGVLTIEEIEKFPKSILETLFEAMSTGEFDVNKGGIHERKRAEVRAIAVGNDISKLPEALKDRFDMTFYYEIPDKQTEKKITDDLYQQWLSGKDDFRGERLRAYLQWIRDFEPAISQDVMNAISELKNAYIDLCEKKPDIREKEAFLKVAYTIAKINRRELMPQDFLQAISLVDSEFEGSKLEALSRKPRTE